MTQTKQPPANPARFSHGFNLTPKGTTSDHWFEQFIWWMQSRGLMKSAKQKR
jgi:hypothetical protein